MLERARDHHPGGVGDVLDPFIVLPRRTNAVPRRRRRAPPEDDVRWVPPPPSCGRGILPCLLDRAVASSGRTSLQEVGCSILSQVCDCPGQQQRPSFPYNNQLSSSRWIPGTFVSTPFTRGTASSAVASTTASVLVHALFRIPPMEQMSCYGYCFLSGSMLLVSTMLLHQGVRALSLPAAVHHVLNLVALLTFCGPQRSLSLFFVAYSGGGTSRANDTDHDGDGNNGSTPGVTALMLLLLTLTTWARTRNVYRQVVMDVAKESACFEESFRRGQSRLERTRRELMLWRYACLAAYSAMIILQQSS
jgi:hypothetical protein